MIKITVLDRKKCLKMSKIKKKTFSKSFFILLTDDKKNPKIFQLLLLGMNLLICKNSNCDQKTRKKLKNREPRLGLNDLMKPETSDF